MKWFNRLGKLCVVMCLLSVLNANVFAEDDLSYEFTADFNGKYIWRGQNLDDDPVLQPGFSATYGNLTAAIWGNLELTNFNDKSGAFTEIDYSLDYSSTIPGAEEIGFSLGTIYYDFPGTDSSGNPFPGTTEFYGGLSLDVLLSPSVTFYYDVDEVSDGLYISTAIGYTVEEIFEFEPDVPVAMELGASYGYGNSAYNKSYWSVSDSSANDLMLSAAFPFELGGWSVSPSVNYVTLLSDVKDSIAPGVDDDFFYVGIGFAKGF